MSRLDAMVATCRDLLHLVSTCRDLPHLASPCLDMSRLMRLMQQDVVSFVLFLHRVVHPKLARDFMQLPDQINRANAFYTVSFILVLLGAPS